MSQHLWCSAERLPPSRLLQTTNHLVLGSLAGLRAAWQVAFWAHASLKRHLWDKRSFPLQVRTLSGQAVIVDAVSCAFSRKIVVVSPSLIVLAVRLALDNQSRDHFLFAQCSISGRWVLWQLL